MKKDNFQVYKIIFTPENENLISRVYEAYNSQIELTNSLKTILEISTKNFSYDKVKQISNETNGNHFICVCVFNNKIVSTFTHIFDFASNEIYLNEALTHKSFQGKGFGTMFYKQIIADFFKKANIKDICATAKTDAGRKFLQNLGFMPNSNPLSYGGNSILYSPNNRSYKFKLRIETLNELCPERKFDNAPNVDIYNTEISKAILNGTYNEHQMVELFKRAQMVYRKRRTTRTLKKVVPCTKPTTSTLSNLHFTMKAPIGLDDDFSSSEIDYNLQRLAQAKNNNGKQ